MFKPDSHIETAGKRLIMPDTQVAKLVDNHDVSGFPSIHNRPRNIPQLHDLLVVYPIVIAIVKSLSLRELISLTLADKSCFTFLRGGNWNEDQHRWDNLCSNCSEVCELNAIHEYLPPITAIKPCHMCRYGVCNHCVGPVGHIGSPRRQICPNCVKERLVSHTRYREQTDFPDCLCAGCEPWLCQMCWKESYLSTFKESVERCCDCNSNFVAGTKACFVCKWCKGKLS